jgi:hypothetical protein
MPYLTNELREKVAFFGSRTSGELNYTITMAIRNHLKDNGLSYSTLNDILGALEGAKLEFYRRVVVPYEDQKKKENGDVY